MRLSIFFLSVWATALWGGATSETLFFLSDDLKSAVNYSNVRYDESGTKRMFMGKNYNRKLVTYARPEGYRWVKMKGEEVLEFEGVSNYAFLQRMNQQKEFLYKHPDTSNGYTLVVDGGKCLDPGCLQDENIISVAIPKRFRVTDYVALDTESEKPLEDAEWKVIDGTYTMYAYNVKGAYVLFDIEDVALSGAVYQQVSDSMAQFKEVQTEKQGNLVKVVMPIDDLFASGSADLKKGGLVWIGKLAQTLSTTNFLELRVEGHTDSTPMKTAKYPSNWELSTARAANVVRYLLFQGFDPQKLAAIGYGESRPIAENTTAEGKMKNRRIEFTVVTMEETNTPETPQESGEMSDEKSKNIADEEASAVNSEEAAAPASE
jgi:flagellar motor protein MotB